jgi:hypothetical protein
MYESKAVDGIDFRTGTDQGKAIVLPFDYDLSVLTVEREMGGLHDPFRTEFSKPAVNKFQKRLPASHKKALQLPLREVLCKVCRTA